MEGSAAPCDPSVGRFATFGGLMSDTFTLILGTALVLGAIAVSVFLCT